MYIKKNISFKVILREEWKHSIFVLVYGASIYLIYDIYKFEVFEVDFLPIGTLGTMVAFLLGFKNNTAYERWWEGRKIWGGIVNMSRTLSAQVTAYIGYNDSTMSITPSKKEILYRQLAYINSLRLQLRKEETWGDIKEFLSDQEYQFIMTKSNKATHINILQAQHFENLRRSNKIENFRLYELMNTIEKLYDLQGKAERIKSTPLMRHYAFFTSAFVWLFILLLPFGFIGENIKWVGIPLFFMVATIFNMIDKSGSLTEDPFENEFNDVALTSICNTIEIDIKEILQEKEIPKKLSPKNNVIM